MPRASLRELLGARPDEPVLMDGGTGGSLEDRGVDVRNDLWSSIALLTPAGREATRRLHADFLSAGADAVIANVHNVCPETCRSFLSHVDPAALDLPARVLGGGRDAAGRLLEWLERTGVEVAAAALPAERDAVLAAGIGSREPWATSTRRTRAAVRESLAPCARALAATGDIFVVFETLSTPPEIAAVAELVRAEGLVDFGIGLTCGPGGATWGGVEPAEVVRTFEGTGIAAFFVQCTRYDLAGRALRKLLDALAHARALDAVAGVYANDGREWKGRRWHGPRVSPATYADAAEEWCALGARIIGGCCGTTPEHVAELRSRFRAR